MTHSAYSHKQNHSLAAVAENAGEILQNVAQHKIFLFLLAMAFTGMIVWPVLQHNLVDIKHFLIHFRYYCAHHTMEGRMIFVGLFLVTLFFALPLSTILMMLVGLTYGFTDAVTLVMASRMFVAIVVFLVARNTYPPRKLGEALPFLATFKRHPGFGLALMRFAPIPDSMVSYGMGTSKISLTRYALVSFAAMLPVTLALVWIGKSLGSITHFIQYIA